MAGPRQRPSDSGVVAWMAALFVVLTGALLALVINLGAFMITRGRLQNGADSAALAAAWQLDGTAAGVTRARTAAVDFSNNHSVAKDINITINRNDANDRNGDVVLFHWDPVPSLISYPPLTNPRALNAVRVGNGRDGQSGLNNTHNTPLPTIFSYFLRGGQSSVSVTSEAIAVGGGPCTVACPVPLALADCQILDAMGNLKCGVPLVFTNANIDTVGFTSLGSGSVNTADIVDEFAGRKCVTVNVGDSIRLGNGNNLNGQVLQGMADGEYIVKTSPRTGVEGTEEATAAIVSDPSCPNPHFNNNNNTIVGFATFKITSVTTGPGAVRAITISVDCNPARRAEDRGGCVSFGLGVRHPRLVQ